MEKKDQILTILSARQIRIRYGGGTYDLLWQKSEDRSRASIYLIRLASSLWLACY